MNLLYTVALALTAALVVFFFTHQVTGALQPVRFLWNPAGFFKSPPAPCGSNFRTRVGRTNLIFLSTPEAIDVLYRDRSRALIPIRPEGPSHLGDIESVDFSTLLNDILIPIIARGNTSRGLQMLTPVFNRNLLTLLQRMHTNERPLSLKYFVSFSLFFSMMTSVFGASFPLDVYDDFIVVDNYAYHLISPLLSVFAFAARRAKTRVGKRLLTFMDPWIKTHGKSDIDGVSAHGNEVLRALASSAMSPLDQAGALQTYMWGAFTNVSGNAFWLVAHLLADRSAYARVQEAVDHGVRTELEEAGIDLLDAPPAVLAGPAFNMLDSALKEAGRLHSLPSSYRTASADVEFPAGAESDSKTFWARKGDIVAANVTGLHWNERWFKDPYTFKVDRFLDKAVDRAQYLSMFARGMHACPGKASAYYYIKMLLIQCLHYYDVLPVIGSRQVKLPAEYPRSATTMLPKEDIEIILVERERNGSTTAL